MAQYLSQPQLDKLKVLLVKEKAVAHQLSGDRFEDILVQVLPDCRKTVVNTRDKRWFDIAQPGRGIEAKTFQVKEGKVASGITVSNVLKRVAPNLLPSVATIGEGLNRQVNVNADPADVGNAILEYLDQSMHDHARQKGIDGKFFFAILFRNQTMTHAGYWEEEIDFGKGLNYNWEWRGRSLVGREGRKEIFTWYWAGGRQLFYRFEAPATIQLFDIPDNHYHLIDDNEMKSLLDEAFKRGYEKGSSESKR